MHDDSTSLAAAVEKRRTFAIISHPDAGKTTLTEKLLLYGGAINTAGQVAARRRARQATSDWMDLERERGISITSTVLQFPYGGHTLNLLDTPGHQDFGEDTYRTLLAADSAVMLIDAAKGVEPQTKKLFAICRARHIPLFTFINKMDRPSRDPLELLDELERVLGIGTYPINWPLGSGPSFRGVYDRQTHDMHVFERTEHGAKRAPVRLTDIDDPAFATMTDEVTYREFRDGLELLEGAGTSFDRAALMSGDATPVFFGSAVTNFGVALFLDRFLELAPPPRARLATRAGETEPRPVSPESENFSGFVFKIQANMDPRHRDRVAFLRVCSGKFERDMTVRNARTGKDVRVTRAMKLFASEREVVDEAYAGDVVGLANPGTFAIGDTLCTGTPLAYDRIPSFAPEHFASVRNVDTGAYKSFGKGIAQLAEEGAIQVFYAAGQVHTEPIFAAVGELQFEVAKYRLAAEYGVKTEFYRLPFALARRVTGDGATIAAGTWPSNAKLVEDGSAAPIALFESDWSLRLAEEWNPALRFTPFDASERAREVALTQPLTRPAVGGGPPVKYGVRQIIIVAVIVIAVLFIVDKLLIHRRNRYESTADAITKAIAHNDMQPVLHAFNAIDKPELEDRARVGHLSDLVVTMGAFKGSKEDTPAGSPQGYHHFTLRFDKGTLVEKYQLDSDGKITKFHIGPSDTPSS